LVEEPRHDRGDAHLLESVLQPVAVGQFRSVRVVTAPLENPCFLQLLGDAVPVTFILGASDEGLFEEPVVLAEAQENRGQYPRHRRLGDLAFTPLSFGDPYSLRVASLLVFPFEESIEGLGFPIGAGSLDRGWFLAPFV